jgi:hypothetical protein
VDGAVAKMREGPSEPPFRRRLQTTHCCCVRKGVVVSEWGKGASESHQVGIKEMSTSEPPVTCRKTA